MRLERAFYTSREGLTATASALAIRGDNVANSATNGFKASRAIFSDLFPYANDENANIPQSGGGAYVSDIQQLHTEGVIEFTDRSLDLAISGNGFFLVGNAERPSLTRSGAFQINAEGILVNQDGLPVLGLQGDGAALVPIDMLEVENGAAATTSYQASGNIDSREAITALPANPLTFNELESAASFSTTVTVFDSVGASHDIMTYFYKTGIDQATNKMEWKVASFVDGGEIGGTAGAPVKLGETDLAFDEFGDLAEGAAGNIINLKPAWTGATAGNINLDLSDIKQYASTAAITNYTRDGQSAGRLEGYEFGNNGQILGRLSSGQLVQIGTLQIGKVNNIDRLERNGSGLFNVTAESGALITSAPEANGFGKIMGSSLERSNVDITQEFVGLSLEQSTYSANSQVLNTINTLYQKTVDLIR
jgi:flagellar hook protein FlgE